jgi:hypothetical protein
MMSEINNDLNLDGNENSEVRNKKENDEISTDTDSVSSFGGNGSITKDKKRERSPKKKDLEVMPKINIFFKKKENENELLDEAALKENELMSKEDKFNAFVNSIASDVEKLLKSDNIELKIQENKKNKKKKTKK